MATAKKTPAKPTKPAAKATKPATKASTKAPAKKVLVAKRTVAMAKVEEQFRMPMEVKEWIDQATSRMKSMQAKIDRLETRNKELESYRKWAEHRILGSSYE